MKKTCIPENEVPPEPEKENLKQISLGLQKEALANSINVTLDKFSLRLQEAGRPKLGKGEMAAGILDVASKRFVKWLTGSLGLDDWDKLTVEAKKAVYKKLIDAKVEEIFPEMCSALLEAMEPHVLEYLDSEVGRTEMQRIREKHVKVEG